MKGCRTRIGGARRSSQAVGHGRPMVPHSVSRLPQRKSSVGYRVSTCLTCKQHVHQGLSEVSAPNVFCQTSAWVTSQWQRSACDQGESFSAMLRGHPVVPYSLACDHAANLTPQPTTPTPQATTRQARGAPASGRSVHLPKVQPVSPCRRPCGCKARTRLASPIHKSAPLREYPCPCKFDSRTAAARHVGT